MLSQKFLKLNKRKVLFLLFLALFVFSAFKIGFRLYSLGRESQEYETLRRLRQDNMDVATDPQAISLLSESSQLSHEPPPYEVVVRPSSCLNSDGVLKIYAENKALNEDLAGWIQMPGYERNIDYPLMQAKDNSFYLSRDFYKNPAICGSIFMDASNNPDEVDRNIVVYGHAMREMSMFGNLMDFPDKPEEHQKNTTIYIDLMHTLLEYEVFSTYYTEISFNYRQTEFSSNDEYQAFLNGICSRTFYDYGILPGIRDKILTLSTCNGYAGKDDRTVIHARLVKQTVFTGSPDPEAQETLEPEPSAQGTLEPEASAQETLESEASIQETLEPEASKEVVSANMYLNELELQYSEASPEAESADYEGVAFDIPFAGAYRFYNAVLPRKANTCRLWIEPSDPQAKVEVKLRGDLIDPNHFSLTKGVHVIKVMITSQDGLYTRTYSISITKK